MKTDSWSWSFRSARSVYAALLVAAGLGVTGLGGAWAVESDRASAAREEAARLEDKARHLKQEGNHDEAQRLMREVENIRAKAGEMEGRREGDGGDLERREIDRALDNARMERKELRAGGKEAEAREIEGRIGKLERRRDELNRARLEGRPHPGPDGVPGRGPDLPDVRQRVEHLRIAADHLRAAGMPEAADRIQRQAEALERGDGPGGKQGPDGPRAFRGTVAQVDELRGLLKEMNRRLERVEKELRERR